MDFGSMLAALAPFAMVVAIIWLVNKRKIEERKLDAGGAVNSEVSARQTHRIEQLEERVRVLESIVTDRGFGLANEIDALRDPRPAAREGRDARR